MDSRSLPELFTNQIDDRDYLPWDRLQYKTPPEGFDHEMWWVALKLRRAALKRDLPLRDKAGNAFHYALTDAVLRQCVDIAKRASGEISLPELAVNQGDRDRYVVNSLIEEAITSSQLEGAATSRRVAKQMIRSGRRPISRGETMIANNYVAMQQIQDWRDQPITPERIVELHRIVTEGTLDDPRDAGHLQVPGEDRIAIWGDGDQLLFRPPSAAELPGRLAALCDFANGNPDDGPYLPPPLRAIVIHFMMGYDHYFADGNGRTARALFYWSMLNSGYWLTEYVTISKILKNAPSKYAGSFLLSEDDDGDLTYFILYHLRVFTRALDELQTYLARKSQEIKQVRLALDGVHGDFNHRQLALLDRAIHEDGAEFTIKSHGTSHRASHETARQDLMDLTKKGLLVRSKRGKAFIWRASESLADRLRTNTL